MGKNVTSKHHLTTYSRTGAELMLRDGSWFTLTCSKAENESPYVTGIGNNT